MCVQECEINFFGLDHNNVSILQSLMKTLILKSSRTIMDIKFFFSKVFKESARFIW